MSLSPQKISQYIKDLGISYKETSKSFIFNCPLCGGKDKLYIRKEDGRFRCFRCVTDNGFKGNIEYAIVELTTIPLVTIKKSLYGFTQEQGGVLDVKLKNYFDEEDFDKEDFDKEESIPTLTWPYHCIPITHSGAQKGRDYLNGRGITTELADRYQIRYSPIDRAVVFPVIENKNLYGWQFRTIDKTRFVHNEKIVEIPKAWSSRNLPRDKVFMFADRLIGASKAVLTEGPIDCLKVDGLNFGNVCTMGKNVSATHVKIILRSGIKTVYAGLDPDAFAELDPLLSKLGDDISLYRVNLPESSKGKIDLGSLSPEEACRCVMNSEKMQRNKLYVWLKPLNWSRI